MSVELKVKAKTLAAESRFIRTEEARLLRSAHRAEGKFTKGERLLLRKEAVSKGSSIIFLTSQEKERLQRARARVERHRKLNYEVDTWPVRRTRERLAEHRIQVVRKEARTTHLARAFLKGHAYKVVEGNCRRRTNAAMLNEAGRMVYRYGSMELTLTETVDAMHAWASL